MPRASVVDTLPASVRRGMNRMRVDMHGQAAARAARRADRLQLSTQGPRGRAGHIHGAPDQGRQDVMRPRSTSVLIAAPPFSLADRQAQFDAAMRVSAQFGAMSDLVFKINAVRAQGADAARRSWRSRTRCASSLTH